MTLNKPLNKARRKTWLRRILYTGGWLLLAVIIFHRPIVHYAGAWAAKRFAKQEHLILDLRISGNIWSNLEIHDVTVRDDGTGLGAVESLTLDRLRVEYQLGGLLRGEITKSLKRVDVGRLEGVITPQKTEQTSAEPSVSTAQQFRQMLGSLELPADSIQIQNITLEVRNEFKLEAFTFKGTRNQGGEFGWNNLTVSDGLATGLIRSPFQLDSSGLVIRDFSVTPDLRITQIALRPERAGDSLAGLELEIMVAQGKLNVRIQPTIEKDQITISATSEGIRIHETVALAGETVPFPAVLDNFQMKLTGNPDVMESWVGSLNLDAHSDASGDLPSCKAGLAASWDRGVMSLQSLHLLAQGIELVASGTVKIPPEQPGFTNASGGLNFKLTASDLSQIPPGLKVSGSLQSEGVISLKDGLISADAKLSGSNLAFETTSIGQLSAKMTANRGVTRFDDIFHSLQAQVHSTLGEVRTAGVFPGNVEIDATLKGTKVTFNKVTAQRGQNIVSAGGELTLTEQGDVLGTGMKINLEVNAPEIAAFGFVIDGALLAGSLTASADVTFNQWLPEGTLNLRGSSLKLGQASFGSLDADLSAKNGVITSSLLDLHIPDAASIKGSGSLYLPSDSTPISYEAKAEGEMHDLHKLESVFAVFGMKNKMAGRLQFEWEGKGSSASNEGRTKISGTGIHIDTTRLESARITGTYSDSTFELTDFFIASGNASVAGRTKWSDNRLKADELVLMLDKKTVLSGSLEMPLRLSEDSEMIPTEEPLKADIAAANLDLVRLFESFGMKAPVKGLLDLDVKAAGTLADPKGDLKLTIRSLSSSDLAQLDPATLELKGNLSSSQLTADLLVTQKDVQPLKAKLSLPFTLVSIMENPSAFRDIPIQGEAVLPSTSLAFLPRFVPAIARTDGTIAMNIMIAGTAGNPDLKGFFDLDIKVMRMVSETMPGISNLKAKLNLEKDRINIGRLRGSVGGGEFSIEGGAKFTPGSPLNLDFRLQSKKVLIMRDESLTVRADTDVRVNGPFTSATVKGDVFVTQSRFLKEIDILPLSLPQQPVPQVRSIPSPRRISFPTPPLRDWKFDVNIRTRNEDAILIRGNVARGELVLDLRLGGTGLNPFLDGHAEIRDFRGSLPVGTLEVSRGWVTFSQAAPFEPILDLQAESLIQSYRITAYVSGTATNPKLDLFSEPPLPQQDILSLLTTGTTTGEIGSNSQALAARAAVLVLQKWYRKTFKRNAPADGKDSDEWFSRNFQMDVGSVDARTGRPEVTGSLKLSDRIYVIGDMDMEGHFSGRIRYAVKFR